MKKFGNLNFNPAQQGELDALCGVYAVTNFISRRLGVAEDCEARWDYFQSLMKMLHRRGKFTLRRVSVDGFTDGQLRSAFNKLAIGIDLKVKARSMSFALENRKAKSLSDLLNSLASDEAVIVRISKDTVPHWIMVHSANKGMVVVDDSYPPSKCEKVDIADRRIKHADLENGLVFFNA